VGERERCYLCGHASGKLVRHRLDRRKLEFANCHDIEACHVRCHENAEFRADVDCAVAEDASKTREEVRAELAAAGITDEQIQAAVERIRSLKTWRPGPEGGADPISETARFAVADVVADLSDRRGLKWEWRGIDAETKAEILAKWRGLVADRFRRIGDA
jgi:hypothetical protein